MSGADGSSVDRRRTVLEDLAKRIAAIERPHPTRVAIDGPDAAGKTTLAEELAPLVEALGRPVIRASIDGFHRPRAARYARGELSAEGYYLDSFDLPALREQLLEPLGPGGHRLYRKAVFDFRSDSPIQITPTMAARESVLLFDGVFLLRPELAGCWDLSIFVWAPFEESVQRAIARDSELFGSAEETRRRYDARYVPAQRLYLAEARPWERADVVIDNADPARPRIERGDGDAGRPAVRAAAAAGRTGRWTVSRPAGAGTRRTSSARTR